MDEALLAFAQSVDVSSCRILSAPNLIFLCGGRVSEGSHFGPYSSARDYFYQYITANEPEITARGKLAEAMNRWFDRESFSGDDTFSTSSRLRSIWPTCPTLFSFLSRAKARSRNSAPSRHRMLSGQRLSRLLIRLRS